MKITDLKCTVMGNSPIVRIVTDEGIEGYGQIEHSKPYVKPQVLFYKQFIVGEDPTNVERVVMKIRRLGGFKPWGSAVSAIEVALWDIAGKAAGLPVYKLLGGKVRDQVRVYNTGGYVPLKDQSPASYAEIVSHQKNGPEGFTMVKQGVSWHSGMPQAVPDFTYGEVRTGPVHINKGPLTQKGLYHVIECVEAMKAALGPEIGLAIDCGPGWLIPDAIRLAKAVEPLNLMWLEDLITGDYSPHVSARVYREVTQATSTPIHTGEQIYLRNNFMELIEGQCVRVVGPDPLDVGGLAELKWVAEYADLHSILMAPHGVIDGVFGLAGLVHATATMPQNYVAFEYANAEHKWWYDIVTGLPNPIVKNGLIEVWDRPGLGVEFIKDKAVKYLPAGDEDFFE
ncbi:MAG: mandelate racemase/muconate lactonizing enzyme family protein [Anaerolineales bacterium]|nr:mandelate racemase/muconate lactonizing enzyme family protein [Anaerolineales bacterium]